MERKSSPSNYYSTNFYNLKKLDSEGGLLFAREFGVGSGDNELDDAYKLAVSLSGEIFIADADNCRIVKLSSSGDFLKTWGTRGSGPGEFDLPRDIAVSDDGFCYVADCLNWRIQKFDLEGNFITEYDIRDYFEGEIDYFYYYGISMVDVDPAGNIYTSVGNTTVRNIVKLDSEGRFIGYVGTLHSEVCTCSYSRITDESCPIRPIAVAFGKTGEIYMGCKPYYYAGKIKVFEPVYN
jgi:hypothetical protein